MLKSTSRPWPQTAANSADANPGRTDPWGLGTVIETQTRLWSHFIEANRGFWAVCTPWMQASPWVWNAALAPTEAEEAGLEPARTADGIPDPLESQARSWNRFLDAHRSFWTAVSWPVPGAPWLAPAADDAASPKEEEQEAARGKSAKVTPLSRAASGKAKGARSRAR